MTATLDLSPILKSPRLPEISAALVDRLRDETVRRERFYDEMSDDEKVEFIQGEVIVHSPARNRHLCAQLELVALLKYFVSHHQLGVIRHEKCLCVFPRNDYEPDIVFFGHEKSAAFIPDTMKFPVPDFVVEVLSPTTEKFDRGVKFEDYEAHGVREYWIVDAEAESVEQYVLEEGAFQLLLKSGSGEIASRVIPGFQIPIRAIFDSATNLETLRRLLV
jgi:Uma2 family endonuclease